MRFLPVGLDVQERKCLVVGGGAVGSRKVLNLLDAGAAVTLVSPDATEELVRRADRGEFEWLPEGYRDSHLDGVLLAVAATDDPALNEKVVENAKVRGILVCDASSRERTQVIFGALTRAEGVTVAVFTDGRDPAQARHTRDRVAAFLAEDGRGA